MDMWTIQVNSLLNQVPSEPVAKKPPPLIPDETKSLMAVKNRSPKQEEVFRKNAEKAYVKQMNRKVLNKQKIVGHLSELGPLSAKELSKLVHLEEHYVCRLLWQMEDILWFKTKKVQGHHIRFWQIR